MMAKQQVNIVGAGMAGLLAAIMLKPRNPIVWEAQMDIPNNHSAVLRFRTENVAHVTGIPFKKVRMTKVVVPWRNPVADALAYSYKNTGTYRSDRSIIDGNVTAERFIAPTNLIDQMVDIVGERKIVLGTAWSFEDRSQKPISTIPMPVLAKVLEYPVDLGWQFSHGVNISATVRGAEAYVSLLVPDPEMVFSRVSITGDQLIVEIPRTGFSDLSNTAHQAVQEILRQALGLLGLGRHDVDNVRMSDQRYSKILPIDEDERRAFIHWASSTTRSAWQLGRYATWRPGLLLDDLVADVRKIDRWIDSPTADYEMDSHRIK